MKLNNEISVESESIDLLGNKDFLRFLKVAIKSYLEQNLLINEESLQFIQKFKYINLNDDSLNFSNEELFENLGVLFYNEVFFSFFIDFIEKFNLDKEVQKIFLIIGNHLLAVYKNSDKYANKFEYISNGLKEKVGSLIKRIDGEILNIEEKTLSDGEKQLHFTEITINENDEEKTTVFDKSFNKMNLFDLITFLNNGEKTLVNTFMQVELSFKEVILSKLIKIYNFNVAKFVKFSTDSFKILDNTFIIKSNGVFLRDVIYNEENIDNKEIKYIQNLFNIFEIFGMQFLEFSYGNFSIDGLIDINGNVIYIKGERLINIKESQFENYFRINNRDDFILSKYQILKELKKYIAFNTQDNNLEDSDDFVEESMNEFVLGFKENENVYIEDNLRERIIGKLNNSGEIDFYLEYSGNENQIEYEDLVSLIKVNCKESDILECLEFKKQRILNFNI